MTATRPSTLLTSLFVALAAALVTAAMSPIVHVASLVLA